MTSNARTKLNTNSNTNDDTKSFNYNYKKRGTNHLQKRASLFFAAIVLSASALFGGNYILNTNKSADISTVTSAPANTTLSVTFLNVGQGNCVIAESNGHYMLIDGGNSEYSSKVVSYLHDLNITALDYIVISHYDADHLSGIIGVLNNFNVTKVISPDYEADTKTYGSYISIMNKKSYTAIHPSIGDIYNLGGATFKIVSPIKYSYEDENNNSVGIRLTDGAHSFLILGDAEVQSESDIINSGEDLSCDVYMVSHHGSSNSSTNALLDIANPSVAVISVGKNDYGHPTEQTLNRLSSHNISILRTDQDGTIIAYSGKDFLEWNVNFDTKSIKKEAVSNNSTETSYIGNKNSLKFHLPTCPNLPAVGNQVYFDSREDAVDSGYSPCGVCKP